MSLSGDPALDNVLIVIALNASAGTQVQLAAVGALVGLRAWDAWLKRPR